MSLAGSSLQGTTAMCANSLMMSFSRRKYSTAKVVAYAELAAERPFSTVPHAMLVYLYNLRIIMNAKLTDSKMIVLYAWKDYFRLGMPHKS